MNSATCKASVYFQIENFWMFFHNEINAGDFTTFCHCWRSTGDNIEMLESPAECRRLRVAFVRILLFNA